MWYQFVRAFINGEGIKIIFYNSKVLLTIATMSYLGTLLAQLKSLFGHYFLFSLMLFRINSRNINIFLCFVLAIIPSSKYFLQNLWKLIIFKPYYTILYYNVLYLWMKH